MALDLVNWQERSNEAVQTFWRTRTAAQQQQLLAGRSDQGERGAVTAGRNLDGFIDLLAALVRANGLPDAQICRERALVTLPGYFRPTKLWDLLVLHEHRLIAAIELKSHVGPSFGNNFNNRAEEAIGTACDLWTASREGAFGRQSPPFVGWMIVVEDAPGSRQPVKEQAPHFAIDPAFRQTSYLQRYDQLCLRLVQERLYTAAALLTSTRAAIETGQHAAVSEPTSLQRFLTRLAGHIAAEAASR